MCRIQTFSSVEFSGLDKGHFRISFPIQGFNSLSGKLPLARVMSPETCELALLLGLNYSPYTQAFSLSLFLVVCFTFLVGVEALLAGVLPPPPHIGQESILKIIPLCGFLSFRCQIKSDLGLMT